jgi:ABC-type glycerol-3-phosphate transport system substrate-binding protein
VCSSDLIELPSYDWTLDDFQRIVRQIATGEGTDRKYGFAIEISGDLYPVYPYVWANGGDLFDSEKKTFTLNQKPAYEAIQMLADLYAGGYMPKETIMAGAQTISVPTGLSMTKLQCSKGRLPMFSPSSSQGNALKYGRFLLQRV